MKETLITSLENFIDLYGIRDVETDEILIGGEQEWTVALSMALLERLKKDI